MKKNSKLKSVTKYNREALNTQLVSNIGNLDGNLFSDGGSIWASINSKMPDPNNPGQMIAKNPIARVKGLGAAIGQASGIVGGLANKAISGGYSAGTGVETFTTLGSTAGDIVGQFNPVAGAAVKIGSLVIGGLANRAFGTKVNQAALNAAKTGTNALRNFASMAKTFDDVQGPGTIANVLNAYKGGWFSKRKARRRNEALKRERMIAQDWANRSVTHNINTISQNQTGDMLANYAALGGFFGGINSALDYANATDNYVAKMAELNNKNMTNMFAGTSDNILAFGGNTESNGATWSDGMTHIDVGGSHEENPNEGVQLGVDNQGTPNLVEEGEVIYNDYVFSNRLTVPVIKKKKDLSQEEKVLKKYSDSTYAKAAKRAEKDSGVTDRPNDSIAKRGFEAALQILATSQEKEREKQKLRELQEAIDNMSPEELAALQQLMQAMQQQSQEEAIALQQAQQQQASPEEMQLMSPEEAQQIQLMQLTQLMQAEQLPVAALGGILNTPDNMYPYGGSLALFKKELRDRGISEEDYLMAYYSSLGYDEEKILKNLDKYKESPDEVWNDNNFKREFADAFLKDYPNKKVEGPEAEAFNWYNKNHSKDWMSAEDWNALSDIDRRKYLKRYKDSLRRDEGKTSVDDFNERLNLYNQYLPIEKEISSIGAKRVNLDENGRPLWKDLVGLSRIEGNNDIDKFYGNIADLTDEDRSTRGIYDYKQGRPSSLDRKEGVQLYGWNTDLNGKYIVDEDRISPNLTSLQAGNTKETYPIDLLGDLVYGTDEYTNALKSIQEDKDYTAQTDFVIKAIEDAQKEEGKLSPQMLRYLEYLDKNSNTTKKLFENGKLVDNAANLYERRRNDGKYGIYHYQYDLGEDSLANRYFYKDPESGNITYINKPGEGIKVATNPIVNKVGNVTYNDYEVDGSNLERTLTRLPNGNVWDVSNINNLSQWKALDKPVLEDPENTALGVKAKTNWVDYDSSPIAKDYSTESDPFPKALNWPYLAAGLALLGALGYNILSPSDYSNANAMIKASQDAGNYMPISFRPIGNKLTYNPMDIWFELAALNAQSRAGDRNIMNTAGGNRGTAMAGLLANNYNSQIASGNLYRKALEYNDALEKQVAEFNRGTDQYNSEGFLKTDMANQDAFARAQGFSLEGQKAGYTMRQAIDDAKAASINAGINGLINLLPAYTQNKYNQDMIGWGIRNGAYASQDVGHWAKKPKAEGGKIKRNKKKGLNF